MMDDLQTNPYNALGWLYDEWVTSVQEDIGHYSNIAYRAQATWGGTTPGEAPAHVIELGAGSGRITIPAAQTGVRVTAIDTSSALLERLMMRSEAAALGSSIEIVCADAVTALQSMPDASAHAVIAPFRMLLHLTDRRDLLLGEVARVLVPRGIFAFDLFHPSAEILVGETGEWLERCSFPDIDDPSGTWTVFEQATFDDKSDTLILDLRCELQSTQNRTITTQLSLQGDTVDAWSNSLRSAGFEIGPISSWFDGEPYRPGDVDSVWQTRRSSGS